MSAPVTLKIYLPKYQSGVSAARFNNGAGALGYGDKPGILTFDQILDLSVYVSPAALMSGLEVRNEKFVSASILDIVVCLSEHGYLLLVPVARLFDGI